MAHISFLFYIVSLITGTVSIGISFVIYSQYRKPVIRLYLLFLTAFAMILAELCLLKYLGIVHLENPEPVYFAASIIDLLGVNLLILVAPFFFHRLLTLKIPFAAGIFFFSLAGLSLVLSVIRYFLSASDLSIRIIGITILFGVMGYGILLILFRLHTLGNKTIKKALTLFIILNFCFAPLMAMEILREDIPWLKDFELFELFSLPAYFFCINCLSILFTVRHFNQPPYLEQGKLTPHFRKSFGITDRETEITALFIQGQSYNQIGEQLFISYKTVDNHIRNIYRKTDVKNRLQLLNLVRSNTAV